MHTFKSTLRKIILQNIIKIMGKLLMFLSIVNVFYVTEIA